VRVPLIVKAITIENDLRATLRNFGLKVGMIGAVKFKTRIREFVESLPDLAVLVKPLLIVRGRLRAARSMYRAASGTPGRSVSPSCSRSTRPSRPLRRQPMRPSAASRIAAVGPRERIPRKMRPPAGE